MDNIYIIPVGIVISALSSAIGIGGGLLWAPFLILIMKIDTRTAIMLSFFIQIVGMGSASFTNFRAKKIFWKLALRLLPLIAVGVYLGAFLSQRIANSLYIERGLGIMSLIIVIKFAFHSEKYDVKMNTDIDTVPSLSFRLQSSVHGILSGLFSLGVSDFLIPIMRNSLRIPMYYSIGTCLFINFIVALMSSLFHFLMGKHEITGNIVEILIYSWLGVIIGGTMGPKLNRILDEQKQRDLFAFTLLLIGIHLIYQSF